MAWHHAGAVGVVAWEACARLRFGSAFVACVTLRNLSRPRLRGSRPGAGLRRFRSCAIRSTKNLSGRVARVSFALEKSVPEVSSTMVSTERGPGNAVDTGASSAERRSLRRKARSDPDTTFRVLPPAASFLGRRAESNVHRCYYGADYEEHIVSCLESTRRRFSKSDIVVVDVSSSHDARDAA